jgi:elongation factor P--beta-lysine ligase
MNQINYNSEKARAEIDKHVQQYLNKNGKIEEVETGVVSDRPYPDQILRSYKQGVENG